MDEVTHSRPLLLAECGRCHYRWTEELPEQPLRPQTARARRLRTAPRHEVAAAA